jgi:esterase
MKLNHKILGQGSPIFFLHGLMGMLDNLQAPARFLEDRFQVIIVDLRNHGHSPHSDEFTYESMVGDLIELMGDLNIDEAHFLGHSMGGKVAMKLAQMHPDMVDKLIVADIGPRYYSVHHQSILTALRAVPLDQLERRTDAEEFMKPYISEMGVRQFLMKSLYHPDRGIFAWRFNLDVIEAKIENVGEAMEDADFEGPMLFIRGSLSSYILDEDWPDIKLIFPNAYLVTIDNAGHWLHTEKPNEFMQAVSDFLIE